MNQRNATRRDALALITSAAMAGMLTACGSQSTDTSDASGSSSSSAAVDDVNVNVASLKGPTTIGLVQMMDTTSGIPTSDTTADDSSSSSEGVTYSYTIRQLGRRGPAARDLRQGRHRARALQRRRDSLQQDQCGRLGHRHQHARRALCRDGRHGPSSSSPTLRATRSTSRARARAPSTTSTFSWTRRASPPTSRLSGRSEHTEVAATSCR